MQRCSDNRLSVVKGYTINHRDTNAGTNSAHNICVFLCLEHYLHYLYQT